MGDKSAIRPSDLILYVYQHGAIGRADHVSVDRLVVALVNEAMGDWERIQARAERGSLEG